MTHPNFDVFRRMAAVSRGVSTYRTGVGRCASEKTMTPPSKESRESKDTEQVETKGVIAESCKESPEHGRSLDVIDAIEPREKARLSCNQGPAEPNFVRITGVSSPEALFADRGTSSRSRSESGQDNTCSQALSLPGELPSSMAPSLINELFHLHDTLYSFLDPDTDYTTNAWRHPGADNEIKKASEIGHQSRGVSHAVVSLGLRSHHAHAHAHVDSTSTSASWDQSSVGCSKHRLKIDVPSKVDIHQSNEFNYHRRMLQDPTTASGESPDTSGDQSCERATCKKQATTLKDVTVVGCDSMYEVSSTRHMTDSFRAPPRDLRQTSPPGESLSVIPKDTNRCIYTTGGEKQTVTAKTPRTTAIHCDQNQTLKPGITFERANNVTQAALGAERHAMPSSDSGDHRAYTSKLLKPHVQRKLFMAEEADIVSRIRDGAPAIKMARIQNMSVAMDQTPPVPYSQFLSFACATAMSRTHTPPRTMLVQGSPESLSSDFVSNTSCGPVAPEQCLTLTREFPRYKLGSQACATASPRETKEPKPPPQRPAQRPRITTPGVLESPLVPEFPQGQFILPACPTAPQGSQSPRHTVVHGSPQEKFASPIGPTATPQPKKPPQQKPTTQRFSKDCLRTSMRPTKTFVQGSLRDPFATYACSPTTRRGPYTSQRDQLFLSGSVVRPGQMPVDQSHHGKSMPPRFTRGHSVSSDCARIACQAHNSLGHKLVQGWPHDQFPSPGHTTGPQAPEGPGHMHVHGLHNDLHVSTHCAETMLRPPVQQRHTCPDGLPHDDFLPRRQTLAKRSPRDEFLSSDFASSTSRTPTPPGQTLVPGFPRNQFLPLACATTPRVSQQQQQTLVRESPKIQGVSSATAKTISRPPVRPREAVIQGSTHAQFASHATPRPPANMHIQESLHCASTPPRAGNPQGQTPVYESPHEQIMEHAFPNTLREAQQMIVQRCPRDVQFVSSDYAKTMPRTPLAPRMLVHESFQDHSVCSVTLFNTPRRPRQTVAQGSPHHLSSAGTIATPRAPTPSLQIMVDGSPIDHFHQPPYRACHQVNLTNNPGPCFEAPWVNGQPVSNPIGHPALGAQEEQRCYNSQDYPHRHVTGPTVDPQRQLPCHCQLQTEPSGGDQRMQDNSPPAYEHICAAMSPTSGLHDANPASIVARQRITNERPPQTRLPCSPISSTGTTTPQVHSCTPLRHGTFAGEGTPVSCLVSSREHSLMSRTRRSLFPSSGNHSTDNHFPMQSPGGATAPSTNHDHHMVSNDNANCRKRPRSSHPHSADGATGHTRISCSCCFNPKPLKRPRYSIQD